MHFLERRQAVGAFVLVLVQSTMLAKKRGVHAFRSNGGRLHSSLIHNNVGAETSSKTESNSRVRVSAFEETKAVSVTNDTHVSWPVFQDEEIIRYQIEERNETAKECLQFLHNHMMPIDVPNAESLGFPPKKGEALPDGLSDGIVGPSIVLALDAKRDYHAWTKDVPKDIYFEYVANFANVNEPRTNWRPLFYKALAPIVQPLTNNPNTQVQDVVDTVNDRLWGAFSNMIHHPDPEQKEIQFKSGQTPLIYDPMSILLFGYASCTGISIFLINALRTVGIPARMAGTSAWNGSLENGNHSWIEVYISSANQWYILEAKPAAGGLPRDWISNPCQFWFCNPTKIHNTTFYAASLNKNQSSAQVQAQRFESERAVGVRATLQTDDFDDGEEEDIHFPMAWDRHNSGVPGEDRTIFMQNMCSKCDE
jgi:hypothetical protein